MTKTLIKNAGIYFVVNLLSQAAVFILWIIIAKVLSPSDVGIYVLAIFIVDFFGAFAIFGLNTAITRFYYSDEANDEVLFNALLIFIISNIASLILLILSVNFLSWLLPSISKTLNSNIFLFGFLIIASSFYNFALSHYSAFKKAFLYARTSLLQTVLFFIFSLLFLYLKFSILGIFYALFISYLIPTLLFLFDEIKNLSFNFFSIKIVKSLLHYSIPMMLYSTLGTITMYIGRIFLDKYASLSTLGIYGFFLVIALQVNAIWATFNRAWTPEVFSQLKENKERALDNVKTMAFLSSFLYFFLLAFIIIFAKLGVLRIFLKQEYLSNIYIFYILLLGPLFTGIYTSCYPLYYYENKTKIVLLISVILNLVDVFFTFFMVMFFSQIGAALSYFIVSVITVFAFNLSFKKAMKIPLGIINWSLILSSLMVVAVFLFLKTSSDILFLIFIVVGMLVAYKMGRLDKKKHLLLEFVKIFKKAKIFNQTV